MKKILYLVTEAKYFCSHRLELASFIKQQGYQVAVATKCTKDNAQYIHTINNKGIKLYKLTWFNRTSFINPFRELLALKELYAIYKDFNPDIVHHVAIKPIIYGTIIAELCGIKKIINALAGLGFIFTPVTSSYYCKQKILKFIIVNLFKLIFANDYNNKIILLQNQQDAATLRTFINFERFNIIIKIIAGSGVILAPYLAAKILDNVNNIKIVLMSRLLWTKGILEFVQAAAAIRKRISNNNLSINVNQIEFIIYGDIDVKNPASIAYKDLHSWQQAGIIVWKNFCTDVVAAYNDCHIVVLPSYREGLPKSLIEAALCARAIITTDVSGCNEIVEHGVNGYLVPKQDSEALADAILDLINNPGLIISMGARSREIAINKFSADTIFPQMLALYQQQEAL